MERTTIFYKMRRKMQVVAHKIVSNERLSKIYYRIVMKQKLSFDNPKTFNEKLQWMKLYYYPNNDRVVQCADKYAVREYVNERGLGDTLTPLLGSWLRPEEIDWEQLPSQFVLKCNHGCAYNIICEDKETLNKRAVISQLNKWLKEDFGAFNLELHYSNIRPHRIICEEYLGSSISDYKFFCFNGVPKYLYISEDLVHDRQARIGYYGLDGKKLPLVRKSYADLDNIIFPSFFSKMVDDSIRLAADFPFVRVDFFVTEKRYYFAELTFTPGGCMNDFNPPEYDLRWGNELDISSIINKNGSKE